MTLKGSQLNNIKVIKVGRKIIAHPRQNVKPKSQIFQKIFFRVDIVKCLKSCYYRFS